jgi:hypothetical protein
MFNLGCTRQVGVAGAKIPEIYGSSIAGQAKIGCERTLEGQGFDITSHDLLHDEDMMMKTLGERCLSTFELFIAADKIG